MKLQSKPAWIVAFVSVCVIGLGCFYYFGWAELFKIEFLKSHSDTLRLFFQEHPAIAVSAFSLFYLLVCILPIPIVVFCTLTSGMLFGFLYGLLFAIVHTTIGGTFCFLLTRYLVRDFVATRYSETLQRVDHELSASSYLYATCVRLIPGFPFFIINVALGLSQISLWRFMVTTCLGNLISLMIFVNAGTQLSEIQSMQDVLSFNIITSMAMIGLLPFVMRGAQPLIEQVSRRRMGD